MSTLPPLSDAELFQVESLACDADAAAWRADPAEADTLAVEMTDAELRFVSTLDPDRALRMVREIRRLRRVEERLAEMCDVIQHLNDFLERRGLVAQAQRFVEVRAQLARIHPDDFDGVTPGVGVAVRTRRAPSPAA